MNNKGITKLIAGIIIAVVLIGAFLVPLALILVDTGETGIGTASFGIVGENLTEGLIELDMDLQSDVTVSSTEIQIFFLEFVDPLDPCIAQITIRSSTRLMTFLPIEVWGSKSSRKFYQTSPLGSGDLSSGAYRYSVAVRCNQNVIAVVWLFGSVNQGEAGDILKGFWQDVNGDGILDKIQADGFLWVHVSGLLEIEPLEIEPLEIEPPPVEPEDGEADLIDTGIPPPPPPDTTAVLTMIVIGLIVLAIGLAIAIAGMSNAVILSIGVIISISGLAIMAFGAFMFFVPGLAIKREGNASNMLKGSLNLKRRR